MGKGDVKTAKGKRFRGSYGKSRPKPESNTVIVAKKEKKVKKATPKTAVKEDKATTAKKTTPAKETTAPKKTVAAKKTTAVKKATPVKKAAPAKKTEAKKETKPKAKPTTKKDK